VVEVERVGPVERKDLRFSQVEAAPDEENRGLL